MMATTEQELELDLDEASLAADDLSVPALVRELNLQQRPSWVLSLLMNALERKRRARGLGWSRPWNKEGMTIFRTHSHEGFADGDYFGPVEAFLERVWDGAPRRYAEFGRDLLADPMRMGFTFYHNRTAADGTQYEGLTISLGRRVPEDRSKRDRLDLVLEDARVGGTVDGRVDQVRVYVCPWSLYGEGREFHLWESRNLPTGELAGLQPLYESCVAKYHEWKGEPDRQWDHWSARYIDYFGPRQFIPRRSAFT